MLDTELVQVDNCDEFEMLQGVLMSWGQRTQD